MNDLELAERAAHLGGDLLLDRFHGPLKDVESKSTVTDLVSEADRASEAAIKDLLAGERPDDGLLAEEGSAQTSASGRRWVVDPLDGTVNYLYRLPAWCVSVALEDEQGSVVAVVHDPLRDETFTAERGGGARLNGEAIHSSGEERPERALIATGFSYSAEVRARQAEVVTRVLPIFRDIRRAGAAALDLSYLAAGRVDGYYERGLKPWDWAAARLIVTEAGGAVAELPGEPAGLAAAAPGLLPRLLELVS
ncbi:MAG TPA: inositol monophosphatase family protein [Thermoleophilaceae bacterium]